MNTFWKVAVPTGFIWGVWAATGPAGLAYAIGMRVALSAVAGIAGASIVAEKPTSA